MNNLKQLKDQLAGIADLVNSFQSEAVQLKITDVLLKSIYPIVIENGKTATHIFMDEAAQFIRPAKRQGESRSPGTTKLMHRLLITDFFNTPQSINDVTTKINSMSDIKYPTSAISGILISSVKNKRLIRDRKDKVGYVYTLPNIKNLEVILEEVQAMMAPDNREVSNG